MQHLMLDHVALAIISFSDFRSNRFELILIPFIHTFEIYFAVNKDLLQIIVLSRSQTFDSERSKEAISLED